MVLARSYLREILVRLVVALAGVVFLVGLGAAIRASATSQGAPLWVPLSLVPLIVGQALPYFFPVVLMVAVVLTYGRMAADLEHVAGQAAGIRPAKTLLAALCAGVMMTAVAYPVTSSLVPELYHRMRTLMTQVPVAALQNTNPGRSELHYGNLYLSWHGRSGPGVFHNVLLSLSEDENAKGGGGTELRLRADRARMLVEGSKLSFAFQGLRSFRDTKGLLSNPDDTWLRLNLSELQQKHGSSLRAKDMPSSAIRAEVQSGKLSADEAGHYRFIYWQRMSMCVAILPLSLVGALLGLRLRKGGFLAAFSASLGLLLFVYYPVFFLCDNLEEMRALPPLVAAWLPIFSLLPVALFLYWKESRRA